MTWQGVFVSHVAVNWNDHKLLKETDPRDKEARKTRLCVVWIICLCPTVANKSSTVQTHQNKAGTVSQVKPGLVGLGQCEPWHAGFGQHGAKPWTDTKASSLTVGWSWVQTCSPSPSQASLVPGRHLYQEGGFSQAETHHLQFGCADPCDFHRCKANE